MTINIGVHGASGGLGASSLVSAVAVRAAQAGRRVCCLDHRPTGGGLDVVLGVEQRPGLRWPDLHRARGVVDGEELMPALPGRRGVRVVAHDRRHPHDVPLGAVEAVRRGLEEATDLVVHDLPEPAAPSWPVLVRDVDLLVLLGGAEAHQVAAVAAMTVLIEETGVAPVLVIRARRGGDHAATAALLGLPLLGVLADDRGIPACLARGAAPGARAGSLRDVADRVLAAACAEAVAA